mmetsp:Transcript_39034/g.62555  ORF Transcript_39034/g.62555 Transcript_39034/m.62555 type:complete len:402 (-) Transcript_39034:260-1465(-)
MGNLGTHLRNHYTKEDVLGRGAFARVFKVRHKKTKDYFAAKSIPKAKLDGDLRQLVDTEIKILTEIKHPNCCNLVEYFESEKKIYLIQELMRGPTLYERFAENEQIAEWHVAVCIQKIAKALKYLHSKGIVHRDLKPQNIMFAKAAKDDDGLESLKILDFGFAKHVKKDGYTSSSRGTPRYVAPEVVFKNKQGKIEYGTSCDMWSLGVIMYELLSGVPPFPDKSNLPDYFRQMKKCRVEFPSKYWKNVSREAKELILYLLEKEPKRRFSASKVLEHKWITTNCQFDDHESMMESSLSLTSQSTLGKDRNRRLKIILFKNQLHRVIHYLVMLARLRDAMDSLLKTCTGEGADAKLDDLVKAGAGMKSPSSKNEDFRRFSNIIRQKAFARFGDKNAKKDENPE